MQPVPVVGAGLSLADVEAFLQKRYGAVRDVARLRGGLWSTAYRFDADVIAADRFDSTRIEDRLACYQLHIALTGMQYQAFAQLDADLAATALHTDHLLATL